jgi:glycosyltransferase involved in cell wall biosynthesis
VLKPLLRPLRDELVGWRTRRHARPDRAGIHVFYGLSAPDRDTTQLGGGLVKLAALQDHFPNSVHAFNLLYLVSSRLPAGAARMAESARRAGARVVLNQDGVAYQAWFGTGWQEYNAYLGRLLHAADYVFFQSEFCKRAAEHFLGRRNSGCEVLYNAVDTRAFSPDGSFARSREPRLLVAGTHKRAHRVRGAIETLALLTARGVGARLDIAGRLAWSATAQEEVAALTRELNLEDRVELLGPYSQADAPRVFGGCDVLLHTQYNDACPTVVIEAMACGVPVVYSASGGTPELVGDEAGIGLPVPESWEREHAPAPVDVAEAVLGVLETRRHFAEAARQRAVERFDVQPWLARHVEVFEALLT